MLGPGRLNLPVRVDGPLVEVKLFELVDVEDLVVFFVMATFFLVLYIEKIMLQGLINVSVI